MSTNTRTKYAVTSCWVAALLMGIASSGNSEEGSGLIGLQYGSNDFKRPQRRIVLESLEQHWTDEDSFGSDWSGRWLGTLTGPATGQVNFQLETNRDVRLKIDAQLVLDSSTRTTSKSVHLRKGKKYTIQLSYVNDGGGANCDLKITWSWNGKPPAVIGKNHLQHSNHEVSQVASKLAKPRADNRNQTSAEDRIAKSKGIAFQKRAGEMDITIDGAYFATYVWSDPKTTRPYFKHVHALGGKIQLTRNHPPQPGDLADHETYHPGIWWGFGDVGGNDYWRMKAKVIGGSFISEPTGGDDHGSFAVRNRMLTNDGTQTFCDQICRYTILKRAGGILMLCESSMKRDKDDFWLGDQEEMGLSFRVATPIAIKSGMGGVVVDSEGRTELRKIRTNQSDWCDYGGPIAGQYGGILLMNDPRNFRKPWWHAVDTGQLVANPLGESELNGRGKKRQNVLVKKDEAFRLRYGILIHLHENKDEFDAAKEYQRFLDELPNFDANKTSAVRTDLPNVLDGFEISIFAQEPRVYKPTAICFDAQGRLMVGQGPQYPKNFEDSPTDSVVLLTDFDNDGNADETKTFATGFNSIQGLAWKGNDLYVANAPELTVVRDLDGDDEADEYVVVYTDLGNREHALHGLNWAPDGKLYMSKGNSKGHNQPEKYGYVAPKPFRDLWDVVHPPGAPDFYPPKSFMKHSYRKTYHHWDDDWGREGGILRCDPLGANLEIVSRGLRNPWDITMDDGFHWLGTDNDQDQGDRIIMPFYGAHFGWGHSYSSHWTGENHLPTAPISGPVFPGSGAGIIFYAHQHFPAQFRHVFVINDWLHGTFVYRPTWDGALMQPEGGQWQPFITRGEGQMLYRPTDLEFAPDGSIYICGWGGGYHYDRENEGSWMFRVQHRDHSTTDTVGNTKRAKPYGDWNLHELMEDLGPEVLPVWRVNAQDELIRRGVKSYDALLQAIGSRKLSRGQQTWAIWALGRMKLNDKSIDAYLRKNVIPADHLPANIQVPLNLRIQSLRILAHRSRLRSNAKLSDELIQTSLRDPEPRIRFEAVQAILQAKQASHLPQLIDHLATEKDRIVYYSAWHALRELADATMRKKLLNDVRSRVRLAALLSLLERHEIGLDDVLQIAESDTDPRLQSWALTWAMNPQPPAKMPNSTSRIELEESFSVQDLIQRTQQANSKKLRRLYLTMISRATYRGPKNWQPIRDFYDELQDDHERALVLGPLSREDSARSLLWEALAGETPLRRAAVKGLFVLSRRSGNSPAQIANFLLSQIAQNVNDKRVPAAIDALAQLEIPIDWSPIGIWDETFSKLLDRFDLERRTKILSILLSIRPSTLAQGNQIKTRLESISKDPPPQLYASLLGLNKRLGITVEMNPPEKATIENVLAMLPHAHIGLGRDLFFNKSSSSACAACHRIAGRGSNFAPDLSGIGLRAKPEKIVEAILAPSASITEGYERQILVTKDGLTIAGAVLHDSGAEVHIIKMDGTLEIVNAANVESRHKTKESAMPTGFELLGNKQVADLVAFLNSCRHGSGQESDTSVKTSRTIETDRLHLKVDFAAPTSETNSNPIAKTAKQGWWHWVTRDWDLYRSDLIWEDGSQTFPQDGTGIDGSGVHASITCHYEGIMTTHVAGMRRFLAGGISPQKQPIYDPICNSWIAGSDFPDNPSSDLLLSFYDLPAGHYRLLSYHNAFNGRRFGDDPTGVECVEAICPEPPMPSIRVYSLDAIVADYFDPIRNAKVKGKSYGTSQDKLIVTGKSGSGKVKQILDASNIIIQQVKNDEHLKPSTIEFSTDGSPVVIVYSGGSGKSDDLRPHRKGGYAVLNAFELIQLSPKD